MTEPKTRLMQRRDFYKAIGKQIQTRREELGMNRARVAEQLGISAIKLARYETGRAYIPVQYYCELYFIFGGY